MKNFVASLVFGVILVASVTARPSNEEKRLIKTSESQPGQWMTEEEIFRLIQNKIHFMDVTDASFTTKRVPTIEALPTTIKYQTAVRTALPLLDVGRIEKFIRDLAAFPNRYYNNQNGVAASKYVQDTVLESMVGSGYKGNASVRPFTHTWLQDSVVARIEGADPSLKNEVVIIGGHMDSINGNNPINGAAPGADDNASGSAAVLETLRALLESGFIPKRSIEFHWYAAEEIGLRGAQAIAKDYTDKNIPIVSMLNFDVVGYYVPGNPEISFLTDYVDASLNALLRLAVDEYLTVGWKNDVCGYGCSDHAAWDALGIPAASPSEAVLSPYMHGTRDTIDTVSFPQVLEFAKLSVAYAIEVAEPYTN